MQQPQMTETHPQNPPTTTQPQPRTIQLDPQADMTASEPLYTNDRDSNMPSKSASCLAEFWDGVKECLRGVGMCTYQRFCLCLDSESEYSVNFYTHVLCFSFVLNSLGCSVCPF